MQHVSKLDKTLQARDMKQLALYTVAYCQLQVASQESGELHQKGKFPTTCCNLWSKTRAIG